MTEMVEIVYSHSHGEKNSKDRDTVPADYAKRLVHDGTATYATKPEAKKAGDDPGKAATAK